MSSKSRSRSRRLLLNYLLASSLSKDEERDSERKRRDRRVPRVALRMYNQSPFKVLFDSKDNQALLNMTGLDHLTFNKLLGLYSPFYCKLTWDDKEGICRLKRKTHSRRHLDAVGSLGLVLTWYRTRGACTRTLALAFGLTSTTLYKWLKFGRRVLLLKCNGLIGNTVGNEQCC